MSENTRTTVNVSKESHQYASGVKDEFDESWSEVLEFYANHRAELSVGSNGSAKPTDEQIEYVVEEVANPDVQVEGSAFNEFLDEIRKTQELAEQARDNTEEIKGSMR